MKYNIERSVLSWCKHDYRVFIDPQDDYLQRALRSEGRSGFKKVKYCRLVRKTIKGKNRFYLQVVLEGQAPIKHIYASTNERLSIDPGPQTIAVFSNVWAGKIKVSPNAQIDEKKYVAYSVQWTGV